MLHSSRFRIAVLTLALACAPAAHAAGPATILVKFKQPALATKTVAALGDDAAGLTANRVSIVQLAPGESATARLAAYEQRADVVYAEPIVAHVPLGTCTPCVLPRERASRPGDERRSAKPS